VAEENGLKHDIYSQTREDGFDWSKWNDYDKTWEVNLKMDIREVRLMYSFISFYLDNYAGAPGRPPEEENYLPFLKEELYKMIQDYNFTHHTTQ